MKELLSSIESKCAKIGIIGLGYVGLPLSLAFAQKFNVFGYDTNIKIINQLKCGKSHIIDIHDDKLKKYLNKSFYPTNELNEFKDCNFIIICVPTPLTSEKEPDLSYIKNACKSISRILRKGQFIILESTTYPGTTEDVVVPILEESGLKVKEDFGVAYSPERVDPGNKEYKIETTPKIVGGLDGESTEIASTLYGSVIDTIVKVKDAKTAEAVKILENIFRNVNIAVVNELSLIFDKMDINTWEVIKAASTKPYGFMAFYPGPGVGGHCIPLDPFYMSYQAKKYGFIPRFIETSGEINEFMKMHVVNLIEKGLACEGKRIHGSKLAIIGLAYKKNIDDTRESPSIKIVEECLNRGADVRTFDPFVKSLRIKTGMINSETTLEEALKEADCAVFAIDHDDFKKLEMKTLCNIMKTPIIIDCKNLFEYEEGVIYLGIGK